MYQSGSLGKQFTAAGILLLAEEGNLGLDDPLTRHLPGAPRAWRKITIRHLLQHTSGLADYTERVDLRRDYTEDDLLKIAYGLPLEFRPGSAWSYSNTGYMVLGIVIGRIAGRHWSEFLAERVFTPLGMADCSIPPSACPTRGSPSPTRTPSARRSSTR